MMPRGNNEGRRTNTGTAKRITGKNNELVELGRISYVTLVFRFAEHSCD